MKLKYDSFMDSRSNMYSSRIAKRQTWNTCYQHLPEAMPCFGWGPFPTPCWSAIPTELVNAKTQAAGVRHSPDSSPATFFLRLTERCEALSATPPDKRDSLWAGTSEQGRAWGRSLRAAWAWGINSYLVLRTNSRKQVEPHHQSQHFVRLSQHFGSRILQAA